jgi:hypothetical protein
MFRFISLKRTRKFTNVRKDRLARSTQIEELAIRAYPSGAPSGLTRKYQTNLKIFYKH